MEMDWDGEWLPRDLMNSWNKDYQIPVSLRMVPTHHPTKYVIQPTATRMILPAKGMLPLGSYIGSPGFGLIHPTTISAAVLQDAGFQVDSEDEFHPVLFDAITLAPNFDFVTGRNRMIGIVDLIAQWSLIEPEPDDFLTYCPENLSFDDLVKFSESQLNRRDSCDKGVYQQAYDLATRHTEDQLLAFHMTPMLCRMGINVRAIMYHHALNRAGLDKTPLRDALTNLHPILNEVIEHAWLQKVDFEALKQYLGDHPGLAETCSPRKFRQLLWDLVGCEAAFKNWQQFTSEEQRLILYASFYGIPAPEKVPYQKETGLTVEGYEVTLTQIMYEYHGQYLQDNSYNPTGEDVEMEQTGAPPPPTEPELDNQIVFDPKVSGIRDYLLALMTDEQKTRLREQQRRKESRPAIGIQLHRNKVTRRQGEYL